MWLSGIWMLVTSCALATPYLAAFDAANAKIGVKRSRQKKQKAPISSQMMDNADPQWRVDDVCTTAVHGNTTLGVAVGQRRCVADQIQVQADVTRAIERVQLCQDPHT